MTQASNEVAPALIGLLARHTGFALSGERGERAVVAIRDAMARRGIADDLAYLRLVQDDPLAFDSLVGDILVGETYFQREPRQWALIRDTILPDITRRRSPAQVIRCWSAGCASGEEPYSLAIALAEAGLADRSQVVGTDISRPALARARAATYSAWSLRAASPAFTDRWLRPSGDRHVVVDDIRGRVSFERLNLVTDRYPSWDTGIGMQDLILCRNVLIYFDRETMVRVVRQLCAALAPGGWLVLGSSDPAADAHAPLEVVSTAHGAAYRRPLEDAAPRPAVLVALPVAPTPAAPAPVVAVPVAAAQDSHSAAHATRARRGPDADARAADRADLDPELHYLQAIRLIDRGQLHDALVTLRRVIYLDRELAVAHFALGAVLERVGQLSRAVRSYRNAAAIADRGPADAPAPLGEGESHRVIAAAARDRSGRLAAGTGRGRR